MDYWVNTLFPSVFCFFSLKSKNSPPEDDKHPAQAPVRTVENEQLQ